MKRTKTIISISDKELTLRAAGAVGLPEKPWEKKKKTANLMWTPNLEF